MAPHDCVIKNVSSTCTHTNKGILTYLFFFFLDHSVEQALV